jgi:kelch-like protein 21
LNNGELVKRSDCYDLTLVADGTEIRCYKGFLVANSPVFKAMFDTDCKETLEDKIIMEDTNADALQGFVEYCYTGFCPPDRAYDLLHLAHKYQVDSLFMIAQCYLINDLDTETVCKYLGWAYLHNAETLKAVCFTFIQSHIEAIADTKDFAELPGYIVQDTLRTRLRVISVAGLSESSDARSDYSD